MGAVSCGAEDADGKAVPGSCTLGLSCAVFCDCVPGAKNRKHSRTARTRSFRRCIVSRLRELREWRQAFGRCQLNLNFTPFAVMCWVLRTVTKDILITQFDANLGSHISQIVGVVDGERTPTRQLGNVAQKLRAKAFFGRW